MSFFMRRMTGLRTRSGLGEPQQVVLERACCSSFPDSARRKCVPCGCVCCLLCGVSFYYDKVAEPPAPVAKCHGPREGQWGCAGSSMPARGSSIGSVARAMAAGSSSCAQGCRGQSKDRTPRAAGRFGSDQGHFESSPWRFDPDFRCGVWIVAQPRAKCYGQGPVLGQRGRFFDAAQRSGSDWQAARPSASRRPHPDRSSFTSGAIIPRKAWPGRDLRRHDTGLGPLGRRSAPSIIRCIARACCARRPMRFWSPIRIESAFL